MDKCMFFQISMKMLAQFGANFVPIPDPFFADTEFH